MKIYIMTDMEGASQVDSFETGDWRNAEKHRIGCDLLAGDINAAVEGALQGGAQEIVVCDAHGGGGNLQQKDLAAPARLVLPRGSQDYLADIDESFDACFLVGAHAMHGTAQACLAHTQSLEEWRTFSVNGAPMGEIGQVAILAGSYGVPLVLATGDLQGTREAKTLVGEQLVVACVKRVDEHNNLSCLPLAESRRLICQAALQAMQNIANAKPLGIVTPAQISLEVASQEIARRYAEVSESALVGPRTVGFTANSARDVLGKLFEHDRWKAVQSQQ